MNVMTGLGYQKLDSEMSSRGNMPLCVCEGVFRNTDMWDGDLR